MHANAGNLRCRFDLWSLGREDPAEEGLETHSSILAWKIPWARETWQVKKSWTWLSMHAVGREWMNEFAGNRGLFGAVKLLSIILQWWIPVIIHVSKPTDLTIPRMSPYVNRGRGWWCQCNKYIALVWAVGSWRSCVLRAQDVKELCTLQFYCEPKTALKNSLSFKK